MKERNRIFLLVLMASVVALGATGVAMGVLCQVAIWGNSERLRETVQSRARLIEAVSGHDARKMGPGKKREAFEATFSQVREAHERFRGFGETGEFTLAKRRGDQIDFLLSHRHRDVDHPDSVPFSSDLADPMRKALSGESGTMVGPDYRGEADADSRWADAGEDAYGRVLTGPQLVRVSVGYTYRATYVSTDTFARFGGGYTAGIIGNRAASVLTWWKDWAGYLGFWDFSHLGFGGRSLISQHIYDP